MSQNAPIREITACHDNSNAMVDFWRGDKRRTYYNPSTISMRRLTSLIAFNPDTITVKPWRTGGRVGWCAYL